MASFAQNSSGRVIEYWYMASYSFIFEPSASPCDGTISTLFAVAAAPESTAASAPDMLALRGAGGVGFETSSGTRPAQRRTSPRASDGGAPDDAINGDQDQKQKNKIR